MTDTGASASETHHLPGDEERRMPFLDHLGELRDRIRNSVIAIFASAVVCYIFRLRIFGWLALPLFSAFKKAEALGVKGQIVFLNPMERFMVYLKTALVASLFLASPVIFYQLWAFIAPGLYKHERRWAVPMILAAVLLFAGGGLFCYHFVLPAGYEFFMTTGLDKSEIDQLGTVSALFQNIQPFISMDEYYGLTLMLLLVFGVVFELPLVLSVLSLLGVVSAGSLWRFNRYAILLFAIAGAILTPGDLVVGQLAMAGSLTVLYNLSILFALVVQRKRKATDAQQDAEVLDPEPGTTEHFAGSPDRALPPSSRS